MTALVRVAVGSKNPAKIKSVEKAFGRVFSGKTIEVRGMAAASGVSDQPMGDEETRVGAGNRARNALSAWSDADFGVGLEGGCDWDGGSNGTTEMAKKNLTCFAWMSVVRKTDGRAADSRTATFTLPPAVATLVEGGMELGDADDAVFRRINSKQGNGSVGILTGDLISRAEYYEHALVLALVPFSVHANLYDGGDGSASSG